MYAPWVGPPVVEDSLAEDFDTEHAHIVNRLKEISAELDAEGFVVDVAIRSGDPIVEIEKVAGHTDLVIATTHGRTGFQRWALGSVSEKLIREGAAPVLVVSSRCRSQALRTSLGLDLVRSAGKAGRLSRSGCNAITRNASAMSEMVSSPINRPLALMTGIARCCASRQKASALRSDRLPFGRSDSRLASLRRPIHRYAGGWPAECCRR